MLSSPHGRSCLHPCPPPTDPHRCHALNDSLLLSRLACDLARARPADRDSHSHSDSRLRDADFQPVRIVHPDPQPDSVISNGDRHPQSHTDREPDALHQPHAFPASHADVHTASHMDAIVHSHIYIYSYIYGYPIHHTFAHCHEHSFRNINFNANCD